MKISLHAAIAVACPTALVAANAPAQVEGVFGGGRSSHGRGGGGSGRGLR